MRSHDGGRRRLAIYAAAILTVGVFAIALAAGASMIGGSVTGTDGGSSAIDGHESNGADEIQGHSIVQGDQCIPIEPLGDGDRTVEELYDYRHPETDPSAYTYSSHGTTHLQEDDTSILFLYEGSDGLSLVLVHDQFEGDTEGGALTMQIDDLPESGEWVVEDDNYGDELDTRQLEEWDHGETSSRITWVWSDGRTDGGAFNGGLEDGFAIQIDPAFNDDADFRVYDGELTDWQALSGTEDDPDRRSLDVSEPIEVRSDACAEIADVDVDDVATAGERVEAVATLVNDGEYDETVTVPFAVDGEVVDERSVTLESGEERSVSTAVEFPEAGDVPVSVGGELTHVTVSDDSFGGWTYAIAIAAVVLALTALVARRIA